MPELKPNTNYAGEIRQVAECMHSVFNKGAKYGRYLERQARLERKKPLTQDEANALEVVWLEDRGKSRVIPALREHVMLYADEVLFIKQNREYVLVRWDDYGTRWRAWEKKPTVEEREVAAWEN